MPGARVAAVAAGVAAVLWMAFDANPARAEEPPLAVSSALLALAVVFGCGAWVMQAGGQPERAPLLAGLAIGAGGYAVARLLFAG